MRRDFRRLACFAAAGILVLVATGCPDSDTLSTGNFELSYVTETTNGDSYDCVLMNISAVNLLPNDGTCSDTGEPCFDNTGCPGAECEGNLAKDAVPGTGLQSVGGADGGLFLANFTNQGEPCPHIEEGDPASSGNDFAFQNFDEGLYRISELNVSDPTLVDSNGDVTKCNVSARLARGTYKDLYGDDLLFSLGLDKPNTVRLVIDAEVLAEILAGPDCNGDITQNSRFVEFFSIQSVQ